MANRLKFFGPGANLVMAPGVVLSSTTEDAAFPLSNLQNPLPTRPYKATSNAAQRIVLDLDLVDVGIREATDLIAWCINWTPEAVIKVEGNPTNSWGAPASTLTKTVPADLETDPDFWLEWFDLAPGLLTFDNTAYRVLYVPLPADISSNRYISLYIDDPNNPDPVLLHKLFFGWGLQFSVNFNFPWQQNFRDTGGVQRNSDGAASFTRRKRSDGFTFDFERQTRLDARLVRYANYEIGRRYCFIAIEPENTDAMDNTSTVEKDYEIRQHALTAYGKFDIRELNEGDNKHLYSYRGRFESAPFGGGGGPVPAAPVELAPEVDDDIGDVTVPSGSMTYGTVKLIMPAGDMDFGCTVLWAADTVEYETEVFIWKNRASIVAAQMGKGQGAKADATHVRAFCATDTDTFVAGDELEVAVRQFSGASKTVKRIILWFKPKSELLDSAGCIIRMGTASNFAPSGGAFSSAASFSGTGHIVKNDDGYFPAMGGGAVFTIPVGLAGKHYVTISAFSNNGNWGGATSDGFQMHMRVNGVTLTGDTVRMSDQGMGGPGSPNNPQQCLNCSIVYDFAEEDEITVLFAQSDPSFNMQIGGINVAIRRINPTSPIVSPQVRLLLKQTTDVVVGTLTGNSVHNKDLFADATNYTELNDVGAIWNGSSNVVTPGVAGWYEILFAHGYTSDKDPPGGAGSSIDACSQNMYIESATLGYRIAERGHRAGFYGSDSTIVRAAIRQMVYLSAIDTIKLAKTRVWSVATETGVITSKANVTKCLLQYLGA